MKSKFQKILASIEFAGFYLKEVVLSNLRVAHDVLTPTLHMKPGIVQIKLKRDLTDRQLTVLANLITMTPGTLSIDISKDRHHLYIHAMYLEDVATLQKDITEQYERRVLNVF